MELDYVEMSCFYGCVALVIWVLSLAEKYAILV